MSKTVQDLIHELSNISIGSQSYTDKYNEVLSCLNHQKQLYTVVGKNTTDEEIQKNNGKIFFGMNNRVLTMWLFSERPIAEKFADYYQFKRGNKYLIKSLEIKEVLITSYFAMFSGINQVIIDEGADYLGCSIYDFVNACFINQGQPPVLEKNEYPIMNALNIIRFTDNNLWMAASDNRSFNNKLIPLINNNIVRLFMSKKDCEEYYQQNRLNIQIKEVDIKKLPIIIETCINNQVDTAVIKINEKESRMKVNKLYNLLQRME